MSPAVYVLILTILGKGGSIVAVDNLTYDDCQQARSAWLTEMKRDDVDPTWISAVCVKR
jgi:hypothetical protein